jgi:hypothetical protein
VTLVFIRRARGVLAAPVQEPSAAAEEAPSSISARLSGQSAAEPPEIAQRLRRMPT